VISIDLPVIQGRAFLAIREKFNRALSCLSIGDVQRCLATADLSMLYRNLRDTQILTIELDCDSRQTILNVKCSLHSDQATAFAKDLQHFKLDTLPIDDRKTVAIRLWHAYPLSSERTCSEAVSILSSQTADEVKYLAKLTEQSLSSTQKQLEVVEKDLQVAAEIQQHMLPSKQALKSIHPDIDCHAYMIPSRDIGGDLFEILRLSDQCLGVAIGDVSGKGVPAAMMMATCITLIRAYFETHESPGLIMSKVNHRLCEGNEEDCMFTTLFLGMIDLSSDTLTFSNAGHNPSLIMRTDGTLDILDNLHGPAIGVFADHTYSENSRIFAPGERLLLYTDGVSESFNNSGSLYGFEKIQDYCLSSYKRVQNSRRFLSGLLLDINEHSGTEHSHDDVTLLTVQRNTNQASHGEHALITLEGLSDNIASLKKDVERSCQTLKLSATTTSKTLLIIDELLANISSHSRPPHQQRTQIKIQMEADPIALTIEVHDNGLTFDPLRTNAPEVDISLEEREEGGLGLFFVKNMADQSCYERKSDWNCLRLTITREAEQEA